MADSGISFKLMLDSLGFTEGVEKARASMKKLIDETSKKGFFEKLNTDVKRVTSAFSQMGQQMASGDIFGALASGSSLAAASIGELGAAAFPLALTATALVGVGVAAKGMWDAMSKANEIKNLADSSLMTTKELLGLEQAFAKFGMGMEEIPTILGHFVETLMSLGDPMSKASTDFARLGLNMKSFQGKTIAESLYILANALTNAKNKSDALTVSQDAFGLRKGSKMLGVLTPENLNKSQTMVLGNADIYERMAQQFLDFQNAIRRLKPALDTFFAGMASKVVPAFISIVEKIERIDLTKFGQQIGDMAIPIIQMMIRFTELAYNLAQPWLKTIDVLQKAISQLSSLFAKLYNFKPFSNAPTFSEALENTKENVQKNKETFSFEGLKDFLKNSFIQNPFLKLFPFLNKEETPDKSASETSKLIQEPKSSFGFFESKTRENALKIPEIPLPVIPAIVDSLTRIGGGGGFGESSGVDVQREQLNVLRRIADGIGNLKLSSSSAPVSMPSRSSMWGAASLAY